SAFGDVYAWLRDLLSWSFAVLPAGDVENATGKILQKLTEEAQDLPLTDDGITSSDWFNGRRTPFADQTLKGGITGLTLGTTPAQIFRSLVEATAFGSKAIMDHIEKEGVKVTEVIGVGGKFLKKNLFFFLWIFFFFEW
ncbi:MAG TPA: hypothetical protein DER39_11545, partial [Porphyromonadaceae bacterium]|nr:hypothetical protein [Porphyromonadaceae bacterium]